MTRELLAYLPSVPPQVPACAPLNIVREVSHRPPWGRFWLLALAAWIGFAQGAQADVQGEPLAPLRWQYRVVLLFAASDQSPDLQVQREQLTRRSAELSERDLLVIEVVADEVRMASAARSLLPDLAANELRKHFAVVASEFAVMLVGKDGQLKQRTNGVLQLDTLFDVIDAMPMRQRERGLREQTSEMGASDG